jgi:3-oxoacyl-[acyl-carrier-protein] synthase III
MIAIHAIASYVPESWQSNLEKQELFGVNESFLINKVGVERLALKAKEEETSDMCVKAYRALEKKTQLFLQEVECIIVCTQNPDGGGIPHTSAVVHGKLGAPEYCACFDISLGCSGYVYGLSIATSFMHANGMKKGLLFTADPYSKIINPADKNTVLLFGDAASVSVLMEAAEGSTIGWTPAAFRFASRGKDGRALHNDNGKLHMNGRAIFNLAATAVPAQVQELLRSRGLAPADIDFFVFHQGSKYIIDELRKRMTLPPEKVPCNLLRLGNTVSSSIPILLGEIMEKREVKRILLSGFGVGLSWASCLLERQMRNEKGQQNHG